MENKKRNTFLSMRASTLLSMFNFSKAETVKFRFSDLINIVSNAPARWRAMGSPKRDRSQLPYSVRVKHEEKTRQQSNMKYAKGTRRFARNSIFKNLSFRNDGQLYKNGIPIPQ